MNSYEKKRAKNENFFTRTKICHGLCLIFLFIWLVIQHSDESFTDLRLIFLLVCWTNAVIMWIRNYEWFSVMEFVVIGIGGYWLDYYYLTFPFYSIAKLLSSFSVFLLELILYIPVKEVVKESTLIAVEDENALGGHITRVGLALKDNVRRVKETLNGIGK